MVFAYCPTSRRLKRLQARSSRSNRSMIGRGARSTGRREGREMTGKSWWVGVVAVFALGLVGPSAAEETPEDAVEVDEGAATADAVFEFLVAEFASQRGDTDGALSVYHRLAREL